MVIAYLRDYRLNERINISLFIADTDRYVLLCTPMYIYMSGLVILYFYMNLVRDLFIKIYLFVT